MECVSTDETGTASVGSDELGQESHNGALGEKGTRLQTLSFISAGLGLRLKNTHHGLYIYIYDDDKFFILVVEKVHGQCLQEASTIAPK